MSDQEIPINIDKDNLDEECVRLPSEYDEWATIEEKASFVYDALVTKRAVVKAATSLRLRGMSLDKINRMFKLNLDKLTEQVYKDLVYLHEDVVKVTSQRDEAAEAFHVARAKRQSLEKKKAMLDYLTTLHGQGYFARVGGKAFRETRINVMREGIKKVIDKRIKVITKERNNNT